MLPKLIKSGIRAAKRGGGSGRQRIRVVNISIRRFGFDPTMSVGHVQFSGLREFYIGKPTHEAILDYVNKYNFDKILLISSSTLDEQSDIIEKIESALDKRLKKKITGIQPHNPAEDAFDSIEFARDHDVDCIVVIGGGSVIDNGKMAALLKNEPFYKLRSPNDIDNYVATLDTRTNTYKTQLNYDIRNEDTRVPSIVMVPTTLSGTTHNAAFNSINFDNRKRGITHPSLMPKCVIFDPLVTQYTPKWLWYSTAITGFDHCIEAIASQFGNVFWEQTALATLRVYLKYLPLSFVKPEIEQEDDSDTEYYARLKCLLSSMNAILPIAQGCPMGASHGITYAMGTLCDVPHGYTSCVINPSVLKWNLANCKDDGDFVRLKQLKMKRVFWEVFDEANYDGDLNKMIDKYQNISNELTSAFTFEDLKDLEVSELADQFIRNLGMPRKLSEIGIDESMFDDIVKTCFGYGWIYKNPVPMVEADVEQILQMSK